VHAHPSSAVYRQDFVVTVRVTYRDGNDVDSRMWYRSSATLAYISILEWGFRIQLQLSRLRRLGSLFPNPNAPVALRFVR
jgi:hypothetical protein